MSNFPVDRIRDNRLQGLLRELLEAIAQEGDPEKLRKLGQSLKLIGDRARGKAFEKSGGPW